jgi:hypothetical protein
MKIQYLLAVPGPGPPHVGTVLLLRPQLVAVAEAQEGGAVVLVLDGFVGAAQTSIAILFIFGVGLDVDNSLRAGGRVPQRALPLGVDVSVLFGMRVELDGVGPERQRNGFV